MSCWMLGCLDPLDKKMKLFFESVCQYMIGDENLTFWDLQCSRNFKVASNSLWPDDTFLSFSSNSKSCDCTNLSLKNMKAVESEESEMNRFGNNVSE